MMVLRRFRDWLFRVRRRDRYEAAARKFAESMQELDSAANEGRTEMDGEERLRRVYLAAKGVHDMGYSERPRQ